MLRAQPKRADDEPKHHNVYFKHFCFMCSYIFPLILNFSLSLSVSVQAKHGTEWLQSHTQCVFFFTRAAQEEGTETGLKLHAGLLLNMLNSLNKRYSNEPSSPEKPIDR